MPVFFAFNVQKDLTEIDFKTKNQRRIKNPFSENYTFIKSTSKSFNIKHILSRLINRSKKNTITFFGKSSFLRQNRNCIVYKYNFTT